jgi:hypothetical protein
VKNCNPKGRNFFIGLISFVNLPWKPKPAPPGGITGLPAGGT